LPLTRYFSYLVRFIRFEYYGRTLYTRTRSIATVDLYIASLTPIAHIIFGGRLYHNKGGTGTIYIRIRSKLAGNLYNVTNNYNRFWLHTTRKRPDYLVRWHLFVYNIIYIYILI